MLRFLRIAAGTVLFLLVAGVIGGAAVIGLGIAHFSRDLPDYQQITNYVPATGTKVYAGDDTLIAEFETERRIPIAIAKVPRMVIQAFLAAEDRDFYNHKGVDPAAIVRAAMADIMRFQRGQRPMGASTITMQVVRHFLLNREVSVSRKIREALLAYRIEHTLSKDRILEIYLNEIYFGAGAYGVAAAADTYFQKPLDQLTLAEAAFLAALPKAPNNYHPIRHAAAAKARRDYVVAGMAELGWISVTQAKAAMAEPLAARLRSESPQREHVGYFVEEVRRELLARFGEKAVYEGGMTIRTSYVPAYQQMAEAAFRKGVVEYDRRHGWRGPVARLGDAAAAQSALATTAEPPGIGNWQLAAVTETDAGGAMIALKNGATGRIPIAELRWARRTIQDQRLGPAVRTGNEVVAPGDIVLVEPVAAAPLAPARGRQAAAVPSPAGYGLRQVPDISGGVVVMDPKTGRVFSLVGGWSFQQSQFNRATQAKRQPGSAFKPFVYVTALQNGFAPDSIVEDAPLEISQGPGLPPWRPVNYEGGYVGATTLEDALIHSRNLVTARLATMVGLPAIGKTVQDFDVMDKMPLYYSMSLGAGETTLLRLTNAYAMLDNGGRWLLPSVIDVVQDRNGRILYQKGVKGCAACFVSAGQRSESDSSKLYRLTGAADASSIYVPNATYAENALVYKPTKRDPLVAAEAAAEIVAILQGVVERGTGTAVKAVGKPLAGKTGTTSDWFDAWFIGFSPDLVAGVFVGFDEPRTLGDGETGGRLAAPIFRDLMMAALKDRPAKSFAPAPSMTASVAASAVARGATRSSRTNLANLDDPPPDPYARAPDDDRDDDGTGARRGRQDRRGASAYAAPQWSDYASRGGRDYGIPADRDTAPRQRDYVAPRSPEYPPPWAPGGAPYAPNLPPGYGASSAPPAGRSGTSQMPGYPPPAWGVRPGFGTGGLY
jgi:penicillin-binding protein 1A